VVKWPSKFHESTVTTAVSLNSHHATHRAMRRNWPRNSRIQLRTPSTSCTPGSLLAISCCIQLAFSGISQQHGVSQSLNVSRRCMIPSMWSRGAAALSIQSSERWRGGGVSSSSMNGTRQPSSKQPVRRHSRSKSIDSLADLVVPLSPTELLERIASEAWLCTGLAFNLWSYLGLGGLGLIADATSSVGVCNTSVLADSRGHCAGLGLAC